MKFWRGASDCLLVKTDETVLAGRLALGATCADWLAAARSLGSGSALMRVGMMIVNLWMQLGLNLPMRNYLGFLYGNPVSTSSLFYGGGAAGIYCVATLREARGQGLGAALTLQPLLEAREWGYRIGVLQSSKMGFNIYKRLGFRHLCQIENFYLSLH